MKSGCAFWKLDTLTFIDEKGYYLFHSKYHLNFYGPFIDSDELYGRPLKISNDKQTSVWKQTHISIYQTSAMCYVLYIPVIFFSFFDDDLQHDAT